MYEGVLNMYTCANQIIMLNHCFVQCNRRVELRNDNMAACNLSKLWAGSRSAVVASSLLAARNWMNGMKQFHTHPGLLGVVRKLEVATDRKTLSLEFQDHAPLTYHAVWLKQACHCPKCRDPYSNQIKVLPETLLGSYTLLEARIEGEHLAVSWLEDDDKAHKGVLPLQWLKDNAYGEEVLRKQSQDARPKALRGGSAMSTFDFNDVMKSKEKRLDWLVRLVEDGVSVVKRAPCESGTVLEVAKNIHHIQPTLYDFMFDVVVIQEEKKVQNLAYAPKPLPFHTDAPYYESRPGIQFLHCLKRDECVQGGDNVLIDLLVAAEEFRSLHPEDFKVLSEVPTTFYRIHYQTDRPQHYFRQRPLFSLGFNGEVVAVFWAPEIEGVLNAPHHLVEPYYIARWKFSNFLKDYPNKLVHLLKPGDVLCFNNHRMVHSRKDFSLNGGERHLQGCYVNIDDFRSEVLTGCVAGGRPLPLVRVGNQDYV